MNISDFVSHWSRSGASERANFGPFFYDLCDALGVPRPAPSTGSRADDTYVFEKEIRFRDESGAGSVGRADVYKHECFLLEAKQGSDRGSQKVGTARRDTPAWTMAMQKAYGQALKYAKGLESPPPFIITCDVGWCFELWACFDGSMAYRQFPSPMSFRIHLSELVRDPSKAETLRKALTDPYSLDPARNAAKVTRDVAAHLAALAPALENAGHDPELVAKFLMRCIFTMFAEDVGLLPEGIFSDTLKQKWIKDPRSFPKSVETLWKAMNAGAEFGFVGKLLHFNGGLFREATALPLTREQLVTLHEAAACDWSQVEPAIFGTLLERALDKRERHKLGAHFTPRAYVERLVRDTMEEPIRAQWTIVQAEVRQLIERNRITAARTAVRDFHKRLCHVKVLDPACGTGNFLYVALDCLKRIEAEVVSALLDLEKKQSKLPLGDDKLEVSPAQFFGIETKRWAKEIAELVLWIGYLQCHFRANGNTRSVREPVMRDHKNIDNRDALIKWKTSRPVRDKRGTVTTRWDGETMTTNRTTGQLVPDLKATVPVVEYEGVEQASWPVADFIVGNPPYLGKLHFNSKLGEGYSEALRSAYKRDVPESCDLVMYWWQRAAKYIAEAPEGDFPKSFGFITTKVLKQTFNRKIVDQALSSSTPIHLALAIPDHPWVSERDAAALRVAFTVARKGCRAGILLKLTREEDGDKDTPLLEFQGTRGVIQADLTIGAEVMRAEALTSNRNLASMGPMLGSRGFLLTQEQRDKILKRDGARARKLIKPLVSGKDLTHFARGVFAIDLQGQDIDTVKRECTALYQHLHDTVYLVRAQNNDQKLRKYWYLFRRSNELYRAMVRGLPRFIATTETAKHRIFSFVEAGTIAEHGTISIGTDDAYHLGILSSSPHVAWALAAGGNRGVGDDPRYNKTRCFDTFPFPIVSAAKAKRIGAVAEQIDEHRKRAQKATAKLKLTDVYNVLDKARAGEELTAKERSVYDAASVGVLRQLHDELDALVVAAYGWDSDIAESEMLLKLVELNSERRREERSGRVRYLREQFQATATIAIEDESEEGLIEEAAVAAAAPQTWPSDMAQQLILIRSAVGRSRNGLSTDEVAATFDGASPEGVLPVLESLAALGVLFQLDNDVSERWRPTDRLVSTRPPRAANDQNVGRTG